MHLDAAELQEFYAGPLGQVTRRILVHRIRGRWRDVRGCTVLGLGYATPFLRMFNGEAERTLALMPEGQGVTVWPREGPRRAALVTETHLPFPDAAAERVLAVHSLEMSEASRALLREIWRVLAPEGRLLLIVPNRRGVWARLDTTPFGQGRPYSRGQLGKLLSGALFTPVHWTPSLFMPPLNWRPILHASIAWERAGSWAWPVFSGVLMVEAQKQVYAGVPAMAVQAAPARLAPLTGAAPRAARA